MRIWRFAFVVCSNFVNELRYIIEKDKINDVDILSFPNLCEQPFLEKTVIESIINSNKDKYSEICIFCSNLFELDFDKTNDKIFVYKTEHCFDLIICNEIVDYFIQNGNYLITPSNLYNFKSILIRQGFDNKTACEYFRESTDKFLILDTGASPIDIDKVEEFREFVNLPCEIFPVGISYFRLIVNNIISVWQVKKKNAINRDMTSKVDRQIADYIMVFEELLMLSSLDNIEMIKERLFNLFIILCAPANLVYYDPKNSVIGNPVIKKLRDTNDFDPNNINLNELEELNDSTSFSVKISHLGETLGILYINGLLFPDFLDHYKSLSNYIASVAGLAISNSQRYTMLKESKDELAKAIVTKEKIFSIIAHDLRGPISSIAQLIDFINIGENVSSLGDIHDVMFEIGKATHSIFDLLENLLQWSRNQKGDIKVEPEKISVLNLAEECVSLLSLSLKNKEIEVELVIDEDDTIYADKKMIITVMRNLIHNAMKFSNKGATIKIISEKRDKLLEISVKDKGVGMKPEILERLFKISENVTMPGTDYEKGTGLGLILCKDFIEKNGGVISVESEFGKGSRFFFTLPSIYKS